MNKENIFKTIHKITKEISKDLNNELNIPICIGYPIMYISLGIGYLFRKRENVSKKGC